MLRIYSSAARDTGRGGAVGGVRPRGEGAGARRRARGGGRERPGELGHCNERARPVCLFISWWISGPTYSLPHTEYLLGVGSIYGIYSVGTNVHVTTY